MFEKASRMKIRFLTNKGWLTVEDLWDLSLKDLNTLAKKLNKEIKELEEEDFLEVVNNNDASLKLSFDITLHILNTKKAENEKKREAAARKEKKEKILSIIAKKQDESLENMSEDELRKALEDL